MRLSFSSAFRTAGWLAIAAAVLVLSSCEPVSVSVNALGDVAFTRSEGIFVLEAKTGKIITVRWSHQAGETPVLVRWAPDNDTLAFTVKPSPDAQSATLYVAAKSKPDARELYAAEKVVTQLEWSPDGAYLSLAQAGEDSELGAADLVIVDRAAGMNKTIVKNAGDVHAWVDARTIAHFKIDSKNPKNSDIMLGKLAVYRLDAGDSKVLAEVKVNNGAGIDADPASRLVAFTAFQTGPDSQDIIPLSFTRDELDSKILENLYDDEQKALITKNYLTLDKKTYRLRKDLSQETKESIYDALSSAGFIDAAATWCWTVKVPDAKALTGAQTIQKTERLDFGVANFVQFSPDGSKILVKSKNGEAWDLGVWDVAAKSYRAAVAGVTDTVSANSSTVKVYPTWASNSSAVFFQERRVYGSSGTALGLMSVDLSSGKKRNLQPGIDAAVDKLVEAAGGY